MYVEDVNVSVKLDEKPHVADHEMHVWCKLISMVNFQKCLPPALRIVDEFVDSADVMISFQLNENVIEHSVYIRHVDSIFFVVGEIFRRKQEREVDGA